MSYGGGGVSEPYTRRQGPGEVASAMMSDEKDFKKTKSVIEQIKLFYINKILPLEKKYWFGDFHSVPFLSPAYFDAAPMVLLLGQYSVGKTSFIRYLLEKDHRSLRIGPEPTTDRFLAVLHGQQDRSLPGNAAAVAADKPFTGLEKYGVEFLNKFECLEMNSEILKKISLVDTPGVLAGAKQVTNRGYDMADITKWFADRCDRILVLFDAHKLDVSDEMKSVIHSLKGNHNKVRIVLNKADSITSKQLMRVYGALMWSLGRVIDSPESLRVFIGSFWERPMQKRQFDQFMKEERSELLDDLRSLPRHSSLRKINLIVRRCRYFKVHMAILRHLRSKMNFTMFKEKKQKELMRTLFPEFRNIAQQLQIPPKDFPDINRFRQVMAGKMLWKLPSAAKFEFDFQQLETILSKAIPELLKKLPQTQDNDDDDHASSSSSSSSSGTSSDDDSNTDKKKKNNNNNNNTENTNNNNTENNNNNNKTEDNVADNMRSNATCVQPHLTLASGIRHLVRKQLLTVQQDQKPHKILSDLLRHQKKRFPGLLMTLCTINARDTLVLSTR